jgi:hypothetical protein
MFREVDDIDYFINWQAARSQLIDLHKQTIEALRVCDVAMALGEYTKPQDQLVAKLFEVVTLDEEAIRGVSLVYTDAVNGILLEVKGLLGGEINNEPEKD